jgi:RND family efflux transporter MFP subunit
VALLDAARTRLAYWDITPEQVAAVEASGQVMRTLTVVAPISGVVMKRVHGLEGMAIRPGLEVIHIADLSTLWLDVEVYEHQLPWLPPGASAEVHLDYLPGERFHGRVRSLEPEVSPETRTVKLTLVVPNRSGRLRVGMYATVVFEPVVARNAVVVPEQAVIRSGERDVVVVALADGRFAPRTIELGLHADGLVQVLDGIDAGEPIVTSAQFLIDSESNLRAAIQTMTAERRDRSTSAH